MITLTLSKKTPEYNVELQAYSMTVEVLDSQGTEKEVFVKQKLTNFLDDSVTENFVAVCSPAQMEDLFKHSPAENTSYFRTSSISLVADNPELLEGIFNSIIYELHKLTKDLNILNAQTNHERYSITPDGARKLSIN